MLESDAEKQRVDCPIIDTSVGACLVASAIVQISCCRETGPTEELVTADEGGHYWSR